MGREGEYEKGFVEQGIYVTRNTVIDSFATAVKDNYEYHDEAARNVDF